MHTNAVYKWKSRASPPFRDLTRLSLRNVCACLRLYVSVVDSHVSVSGKAKFGDVVKALSSSPDQHTLDYRRQKWVAREAVRFGFLGCNGKSPLLTQESLEHHLPP
jgi:hypothetical protein